MEADMAHGYTAVAAAVVVVGEEEEGEEERRSPGSSWRADLCENDSKNAMVHAILTGHEKFQSQSTFFAASCSYSVPRPLYITWMTDSIGQKIRTDPQAAIGWKRQEEEEKERRFIVIIL